MTLKKKKRHAIIETKKVWVTLPLVCLLFLFMTVSVTEESFPHSTLTQKLKMKKQTLNTALNILF